MLAIEEIVKQPNQDINSRVAYVYWLASSGLPEMLCGDMAEEILSRLALVLSQVYMFGADFFARCHDINSIPSLDYSWIVDCYTFNTSYEWEKDNGNQLGFRTYNPLVWAPLKLAKQLTGYPRADQHGRTNSPWVIPRQYPKLCEDGKDHEFCTCITIEVYRYILVITWPDKEARRSVYRKYSRHTLYHSLKLWRQNDLPTHQVILYRWLAIHGELEEYYAKK